LYVNCQKSVISVLAAVTIGDIILRLQRTCIDILLCHSLWQHNPVKRQPRGLAGRRKKVHKKAILPLQQAGIMCSLPQGGTR
jgi:hypothetical protein